MTSNNADFSKPTVATTYTDFPQQILDNIEAALQQLSLNAPATNPTGKNVPTGAIKFDLDMSGGNRWKRFDGSQYVDLTDHYNFNAKISCTSLRLGDGAAGGDNAIFLGDGNDLRLYHSGTDSYIRDYNGAGSLILTGSETHIKSNNASEFIAKFVSNAGCTFYHNNNPKCEIVSGGVDITGALSVSAAANIGTNLITDGSGGGGTGDRVIRIAEGRSGNGNSYLDLVSDATNTTYGARLIRNAGANGATSITHLGTGIVQLMAVNNGKVALKTASLTRFFIDQNGLTGIGSTSPEKLFDVASATTPEVIIRTTAGSSRDSKLYMRGARTSGATDINQIIFETNDTGGGYLEGSRLGRFICGKEGNSTTKGFFRFALNQTSAGSGELGTTDTEVLRIKSAGFMGLNTSNPETRLQINSPAGNTNDAIIRLHNTDPTMVANQSVGRLEFSSSDSTSAGVGAVVEGIMMDNAASMALRFLTGTGGSANEAARFDAGRRFLLGRTSSVLSYVGNSSIHPDIQLASDSIAAMSITRYSNSSASGRLHIQSARGTIASPSVVNNGDTLLEITGSGWDGTRFRNGVRFLASINAPSNTHDYTTGIPTDLKVQLTKDSGSLTTIATFSHDGFLGINKTPTVLLHLKMQTDDVGVFRIEDKDSSSRYCDIDVTHNVTSFVGRSNNNRGIFAFKGFNGTNTLECFRAVGSDGVAIGTTALEAFEKLTVSGGRISCTSMIIANKGGRGCALTANDGHGNASLCFNHANGIPEDDGVAGRIDMNTDSSGGVAIMTFGLVPNAVKDQNVSPNDAFVIKRGSEADLGVGSNTNVRSQVVMPTGTTTFPSVCFSGDADTGLARSQANRMSLITAAVERVRINNSGLEVMSGGQAKAINTAKAWIHLDGSGTVTDRKSFNVDSIAELTGEGNYRITWDEDFSDAYYVVLFGQSLQPNNGSTHGGLKVTAQTTSRIDVLNCRDENGSDRVDKDMVSVACFA